MFLGNRLENVHKYGHVVPRVLFTSCTLNKVHTMPIQAFEVTVNESNEANKAKLELTLIIWFTANGLNKNLLSRESIELQNKLGHNYE